MQIFQISIIRGYFVLNYNSWDMYSAEHALATTLTSNFYDLYVLF